MAVSAGADNALNVVQKRLQDDGEWDRIYANLNELLNEAGWLDDLYDSAKERSRSTNIRIEELLAELGPSSSKAIPRDVKDKVLKMIHEAIERIVEA